LALERLLKIGEKR